MATISVHRMLWWNDRVTDEMNNGFIGKSSDLRPRLPIHWEIRLIVSFREDTDQRKMLWKFSDSAALVICPRDTDAQILNPA